MNIMKRILTFILFIIITGHLMAQEIAVSGRILSGEDNTGLPGVTVVVKGTTLGTITDVDGNYKIKVPSKSAVLKFSSIGFVTQEMTAGNRTKLNLTLKPNITELGEVVAVGFGSQKKASVTGAISSIKTEELKRESTSNLTASIGGRVTGVLVRLNDGNIGGGDNRYSDGVLDDAIIRIRGIATTNNASPLVLVDGVESSFSRINPEDVEQFSVLKDASATAVYGVRGANGVILITTKSGSVGKAKVTLSSQLRMQQPLQYPHPLGAYDYAYLYNEALRNMGKAEQYSESDLNHWKLGDDRSLQYPYGHPDVDWYNELVKDHFWEQQHIMTLSGGTENVRYYVSGEYNNAGGPFDAGPGLDSKYNRYNLRTNLDFTITKTTELSVKLNGRYEQKGDVFHGESTGQRYYGSFWYDIDNRPGNLYPIYNPNGTFNWGAGYNAMADLKTGGYKWRLTSTGETSFNLKQKLDFITKGLSVRGMMGLNYGSGTRKNTGNEQDPEMWSYNPSTGKYTIGRVMAVPGMGVGALTYSRRSQMEFAANYDRTFGRHHVTAMGVYSQNATYSNAVLPVNYRGLAGRATYDWKAKYFAEVNVGYNGSDQFSEGHRYALLPAGSLGWVLSEEKFMKDNLSFINFLKIRGSYGETGNDKIASGQRYLYQYQFNTTSGSRWFEYAAETYNFGVNPVKVTGLTEGSLGNDKVTWEIARKADLGIELRALNDHLNVTADVFQEKRDNILVQRGDVPFLSGVSTGMLPAVNLGKVTNKGYEFSIGYSNNIGDFGYNLGINYSYAHNNIDYIAEAQKQFAYQMQVNHPIGQSFGYVWTGKFYDYPDLSNASVPKPVVPVIAGDLMFKDIGGPDGKPDGKIDDMDRTAIGYPSIPEIVYGITLDLSFKNFYLNTFWQGAAHTDVQFGGAMRNEFSPNVYSIHMGRWVYDPARGLDTRATATYPSLQIPVSPQTATLSTFQLMNGDYVRLKSVEFGYNFPKKVLRQIKLSELRVYLSGSNLLTFAHLKYVDPEYASTNSTIASSTDGGRGNTYPQTKFYAVGLYVTF
jgi:TonB-linked SusC/RagA family outer membrane protein